jgi:hypothetical protein
MAVLNPQPRSSFLGAPVEPLDNARAIFTLHQVSKAGAISDDPILAVTLFHVSNIETPQEERVQVLASNVDSGKLYLFGRSPRLYAISGFIVDSDLQPSKKRIVESKSSFYQVSGQGANVDDAEYMGHLLRQWMILYEKSLRLSQCLKNSRILKFRWRSTEVYGYILGQVRSMESGSPSIYSLGLTFAVMFEEEKIDDPIVKITYGNGVSDDVHGMISLENVSRLSDPFSKSKSEKPKSVTGKAIEGRSNVPPRT